MEENNQCGYYADPECIYSQQKKKEMNIDLWLSLGILICGHSRWMQKTNIKHGALKKKTHLVNSIARWRQTLKWVNCCTFYLSF